ncbi:MAG: DNA gyrase inhibitor YacG [Gallionella sp.]
MTLSKSLVVACPRCAKESPWDTHNRYRPFCSERCKMIDLGAWADETFRVVLPDDEQEFISPPHQA